MYCFRGGSLVRVKLLNSFCVVRRNQIRVHPFGELCPLGFASREVTYRRQDFAVVVARREAVQYFMNLRHHPRRASPAN